MIVGMSCMRSPGLPDDHTNPAYRGHNHVHNRAEHEYVEGTEPVFEFFKEDAQNPVADAEQEPAHETRGQQVAGLCHETKDRNYRKQSEESPCSDVTHQREVFEKGHAIGDNEPRGENHRQANANVNTYAHRCVPEKMEPSITGQVRADFHRMLGSDLSDIPCVEPGSTAMVA